MKKQALALAITALLTHQAAADDVSPQRACAFFFEMFTPEIIGSSSGRPFKIVEVGDAGPEIQLAIPRYTSFTWPNGIAKGVSPSRPDLELEAIAFEFSCLVDTKDKRVLTLSIGPGKRVGERVPITEGTVKSEEAAIPAVRSTVSMLTTPMQGLF